MANLTVASAEIYNSTFRGDGSTVLGILDVGGSTVSIINCAVFDSTDDFFGTFALIDYCSSDDGDGTNAVTPADWSTVFVDYTNGDFHLKSTDTDLIGAGVDDPGSGLFSDDIDGETRTSVWDIGADEYVSAGVTKTVTDTGSGADLIGINVALSVSDSGAGSDGIGALGANIPVADVGSGADAIAQILANIPVSDVGIGTDDIPSIQVQVPVSDTGQGIDASGAISAVLSVADNGTVIDLIVIIGKAKVIVIYFFVNG